MYSFGRAQSQASDYRLIQALDIYAVDSNEDLAWFIAQSLTNLEQQTKTG